MLERACIALILAAGILMGGPGDIVMTASRAADHGHSDPLPGPRDPEIAVREEYDAAIAAGTADALSLFIRRHPDHPLADKAQQALNEMLGTGKPE